MSTQNARKRKSAAMEDDPTTPTASPTKKMRITASQKQALIDNLQLEITERARRLRAQYASQCSDLRNRVERRINRVPIAMRKMKMGDLMAQHEGQTAKTEPVSSQSVVAITRSPSKQSLEDRPLPPLPSPVKLPSPVRQQHLQPQKSRKRKSSAIQIPSDKENHEPEESIPDTNDLSVQKNSKRAKTANTTAAVAPKRTTSKTQKKPLKGNAGGVLSPRSLNSQTLPRSPIKEKDLPAPVREGSPLRQQQSPSRPASPLKPFSPFKAATSAISAFAKRGYAAAGAAGARLARPISREKDQPTLSGTGTIIPGSPVGKMLPPPRPALATLTSTSAVSIPNMSPQRTASQASMRSNVSEQSDASTTATVVTKPARTLTTKKTTTVTRAPTRKITATTAATKAKGKVVVSGSTISTVASSPKAPMKRTATTAAAKKAASVAVNKKTVPAPTTTGRILRKRN